MIKNNILCTLRGRADSKIPTGLIGQLPFKITGRDFFEKIDILRLTVLEVLSTSTSHHCSY